MSNLSLIFLLEQILLEDRRDALTAKFVTPGKITQEEFNKVFEADPTNNKQYTQWMLTRLVEYKAKGDTGVKLFFSKLQELSNGLEFYSRLKKHFDNNDINQYKNLKDFLDNYNTLLTILSPEEQEKGKGKKEKYSELKIGEIDGFTVYELPKGRHDLKAVSCDLGSNAKWCTAHSEGGMFDSYIKDGSLIIFAKGDERYQYSTKNREFKDVANRDLTDKKLKSKLLGFIFKKTGQLSDDTDLSGYELGTINNIDGSEQPLFKVNTKYYAKIGGKLFTLDPTTAKLQDAKGAQISPNGQPLLQPSYIGFTKAVYADMKKNGTSNTFNKLVRLLLQLDVPNLPDRWWDIQGSLQLDGAAITSLPERLRIAGNLLIRKSGIKELPKEIEVGGKIYR